MAYDEKLADRLRELMATHSDVIEKKMFGGLAFMVRGHMAFGVVGDELMIRVGSDAHDEAVARSHARPMDFTGRPMRGMVYVARPGIATRAALSAWIDRALRFNVKQPPRVAPTKRRTRTR